MNFFKPKFWDKNQVSFFSILFFPISLLIRLFSFFKRSLTITRQCSIPIICVGNIYLGGTGKTPLCIEIFSILKNLNMKPVFIRKKYDSFQDEANLQGKIGPIYQNKKRMEALHAKRKEMQEKMKEQRKKHRQEIGALRTERKEMREKRKDKREKLRREMEALRAEEKKMNGKMEKRRKEMD